MQWFFVVIYPNQCDDCAFMPVWQNQFDVSIFCST